MFLVTAEDETSPVEVATEAGASDVDVRTRRFSLQAALPLRRTIRSVQPLSLTWRRKREEVVGGGEGARLDLGGIQTAWTLNTARSYPYSISLVDGGWLRLAWLREAEALGSDLSLDKLTVGGSYYQRLLGERDVLALRAGPRGPRLLRAEDHRQAVPAEADDHDLGVPQLRGLQRRLEPHQCGNPKTK